MENPSEPDYLAIIRDLKEALGGILKAQSRAEAIPLDEWYLSEIEALRAAIKGLMRRLYELEEKQRADHAN